MVMARVDEAHHPTPDELLRLANRHSSGRGRLKVYLGMAAGVGKTVRMLDDAHTMRPAGVDVVVGFVEPHGRAETAVRIADLEVVPAAPGLLSRRRHRGDGPRRDPETPPRRRRRR